MLSGACSVLTHNSFLGSFINLVSLIMGLLRLNPAHKIQIMLMSIIPQHLKNPLHIPPTLLINKLLGLPPIQLNNLNGLMFLNIANNKQSIPLKPNRDKKQISIDFSYSLYLLGVGFLLG